jgi:hypothetical protein
LFGNLMLAQADHPLQFFHLTVGRRSWVYFQRGR